MAKAQKAAFEAAYAAYALGAEIRWCVGCAAVYTAGRVWVPIVWRRDDPDRPLDYYGYLVRPGAEPNYGQVVVITVSWLCEEGSFSFRLLTTEFAGWCSYACIAKRYSLLRYAPYGQSAEDNLRDGFWSERPTPVEGSAPFR